MRENRTYGSEGGEAKAFPTPINVGNYVEVGSYVEIAPWATGWVKARA